MKVNILYICTGNYVNFFDDFYDSCMRFFLPGWQKSFFVFTDSPGSEKILSNHGDINNIEIELIDGLCWPLNTLLRFDYFVRVKEKLFRTGGYTFFFNANALFVSDVTDELIIPGNENGYLVGVEHPGYLSKPFFIKPFERRSILSCKVPFFYSGVYFQGCLNGGRTSEYLDLIVRCSAATTLDLKKNMIAKVHDESYLNWYFSRQVSKPLTLDSSFAWPEQYNEIKDKKIIMRDKNKCDWYEGIK